MIPNKPIEQLFFMLQSLISLGCLLFLLWRHVRLRKLEGVLLSVKSTSFGVMRGLFYSFLIYTLIFLICVYYDTTVIRLLSSVILFGLSSWLMTDLQVFYFCKNGLDLGVRQVPWIDVKEFCVDGAGKFTIQMKTTLEASVIIIPGKSIDRARTILLEHGLKELG